MIKHILPILGLLIFGCSNQVVNDSGCNCDEELIQLIKNSSDKVPIEVEDLPSDSQIILQNNYISNIIIQSVYALNLGYEISLGTTDDNMGEIDEIYFNSEGRELRLEREDSEDKRECFELGYPINWSMPDGTNIIVEDEDDWEEVREWYQQNPDAEERYIQYPVNIIYEDGDNISIASEEDLIQAYEDCEI